jgi:hypothetical protein
VTEQQYPLHLRKIGEHQIAEFLETVMIELDTHEKMFLELCQVKRERDALLGAVPISAIEAYLQRRMDEWNALGDRKYDPANMWGYNFIRACQDDLEAWRRGGENR